MVTQNEKMPSLSETLPLKSNENMEDFEETTPPARCGCFEKLFFGCCTRRDESMDSLLAHQPEEARETCLLRNSKKVQHVSEVLAGPKWKNFIRRSGSRGAGKRRRTQFHYDPHSYALNFDDGFEREESEHPRF